MIRKKVDLREFNTLGVHSVADKFAEVRNEQEIVELYKGGKFKNENLFILGGGSNVLFGERFHGMILKIGMEGIEIPGENEEKVWVRIGAGENWHQFVTWCVEHGYGGVENLALIPGTTGAAPVQNIGAYGRELEEVFDSLKGFDLEKGCFRKFTKSECGFSYRNSIFKSELKNRFLITEVVLQLNKKPHSIKADYQSLKDYLEKKGIIYPAIRDVYDAVVEIRKSKLPDPDVIGNAGSFFKNPVIPIQDYENLKKQFRDMPGYPANNAKVKIPAAWLIEKCGWKGKRIGNAGSYENQALVIVNHGNATGKEIFLLSQKIKESVKEKFGISLVPEVNMIGDFEYIKKSGSPE